MINAYWPNSRGPNFMALLTAEFCAYDHYSPLTVQAPSFCASCVSEECLVHALWSTLAHFKQKFSANLWNRLDVSTEFPASVSADSLLTASRAMKLGPDIIITIILGYTILEVNVPMCYTVLCALRPCGVYALTIICLCNLNPKVWQKAAMCGARGQYSVLFPSPEEKISTGMVVEWDSNPLSHITCNSTINHYLFTQIVSN